MTGKISFPERAAIVEHINLNATEELKNPLKVLAVILLNRFGWPHAMGRKRAAAIVAGLEEGGYIECRRDARNVVVGLKIKVKTNAGTKTEESPRDESSVLEPPTPALTSVVSPTRPRRRKFNVRKKGVVRRRREANDKGDRNEARFHGLATRLLSVLAEFLPITRSTCIRSGKHDPKHGKIDWNDHTGEDVRIEIYGNPDGDGKCVGGKVIYQVKSFQCIADRFNRKIIRFPGQEDALLKKAVAVNRTFSDRDVVGGIIDDLLTVGILTPEFKEQEDRLLRYF